MADHHTTPDVAPSGRGASLFQRIRDVARRPWFSYLMLALLQLKIVWGAWDHRDLTTGDTAGYFLQAWQWHEIRLNHFEWSPLYTAFYGTVLDFFPDPVAATLLHRLLIVFAAGALVLALLRRLVSPGVAWLAAAWWAVLPINFNTLYEVHLFSLLPVLAAWLLVARWKNAWGRGGALAVLAGSTLLVRNELVIATGLWALACAALEWRAGAGRGARRLGRLAAAYGLPLAAAAALCLLSYSRSITQFPEVLPRAMRIKHTLNMAQVYCYGYQQRHPEWTQSPWSEYQQLMTEKFGTEQPSLRQMIAANPRAVAGHFAWNLSMVPNGLQILLFNATSGERNPDYVPVNSRSEAALVLTVGLLALWLAGLVAAVWGARRGWLECLRGRGQLWLIMGCVAAVSLFVIPTQRPRPSYLFPLGLLMMGVTASCVQLLAARLPLTRRMGALLPAAMIGLIAVVPPYYQGMATPVRDVVRTLQPYQGLIAREKVVFVKGEFAFEVFSYVARERCAAVHDYGFLKGWAPPEALDAFLTRRGVHLFYLDQDLLARLRATPEAADVFLGPGNDEWGLAGAGFLPGREWRLFMRKGDGPYAPEKPPESVDIPADLGRAGVNAAGIAADGWTGPYGQLRLGRGAGADRVEVRGMVPLIRDPTFATNAVILLDGKQAASHALALGEFVIQAPLPPGERPVRVEVRFDRLQTLPAGDGREVGARLSSAAVRARD